MADNKKKITKRGKMTGAVESLRQILKEIEPFVNKPKMREYSTAGQWFNASDVANFSK